MIYDITKTNVSDLVKSETLINSILSKKPEFSQKEAREQIIKSWHIAESFIKKDRPIEVEGLCQDCGSNKLVKTGTCAVCAICGSSQGCS